MKNLHYVSLFLLFFWGSAISVAQSSGMLNSGTFYVGPQTQVAVQGNFDNAQEAVWNNDGKGFFYGDFNNAGLFDYIDDQAEISFRGATTQVLSGNGENYFNNIIFNNEAATAFQLKSYFTVFGQVDFKKGIVDNANHGGSFYFAEGSSHLGAGHNSHVDGPVRTSGGADFEFPIGNNGTYAFASLSEFSFSDPYQAQYFQKNSNSTYSHSSKEKGIKAIDTNQYWEIVPEKAEAELVLTLPLDERVISDDLLQDLGSLNIVRWNEDERIWVDQGGAVDIDNQTVSALVSDYGIFALASVEVEAVLPCELVIYNAITPNADNKNDFFLIEQKNGSGSCFLKLGVQIFDKWGTKVFETPDYGVDRPGGVFNGQQNVNGKQKKDKLPTGNYFYVLDVNYKDAKGNPGVVNKSGYLYLKDE